MWSVDVELLRDIGTQENILSIITIPMITVMVRRALK